MNGQPVAFWLTGSCVELHRNPDNPAQVAEEARSWGDDGDRLYFDYFGVAPLTRAPIVLVEAKGYDVKARSATPRKGSRRPRHG